jgi:hypothetical protein
MSDLSARVDQTLADKKKEFSAKFGLDDKVTILLGFHGDGVPFQKSTHKLPALRCTPGTFSVTRVAKGTCFAI